MVQLIREMECRDHGYLTRPGVRGVSPNVFELIGFGFACGTVPIHCLILIIIILEIKSNNRTNNSFYVIVFSLSIIDLICLVFNYLMYSFPRWDFYPLRLIFINSGQWIVRTGFFITWGIGLFQVCLTLLMTVNRFTALIFPCQHDAYWRNKNMVLIIGIPLLGGILFASPILITPVCIVESNTGELYGRIINNSLLKYLYSIAGLFLLTSTTSMIVMYCIIFKVLSGRRKTQSKKLVIIGSNFIMRATVQKKREHKLLIMSLIVCIIEVSITIFVIVKFAFDYDPLNFWYNHANTFYSSINSYLLIIFSDVMRRRFCNIFIGSWRPERKTKTTTFIVHYSQNKY